MRCETCKHWLNTEEGEHVDALSIPWSSAKDYSARLAARNADIGRCDAAVHPVEVDADEPVPMLMSRDASDYQSNVYTRRDFGCVLHEVQL